MENDGSLKSSLIFFNPAHDPANRTSDKTKASDFANSFQIWVAGYKEPALNERKDSFSAMKRDIQKQTLNPLTKNTERKDLQESSDFTFEYTGNMLSDDDTFGFIEWNYTWRRAVCAIDESGKILRIIQQYAFSAAEYKNPNTTKTVLNESISFSRIDQINITPGELSRFDLKIVDGLNEATRFSFFVLNGPSDRITWFIQKIAEKASLEDPFKQRSSSPASELRKTKGRRNERELGPNILVSKFDEHDFVLIDSFHRIQQLFSQIDESIFPEEIFDALNLYRDYLSVPALWFYMYLHLDKFSHQVTKPSRLIQDVARSLDYLLESQESYVRADLESFSAFFKARNESLTTLKNSSIPHRRRHHKDKSGLIIRNKGKGFCTVPLENDFSKTATLLELRETSKRNVLNRRSNVFNSEISPTQERPSEAENWRVRSVNITALLRNRVGDQKNSIVRPFITDMLFRLISSRKVDDEDVELVTTYETLTMLLINFKEDLTFLRSLTHLLYGNLDFLSPESEINWPHSEELYERLVHFNQRVSHRILQSPEVHRMLLHILQRVKSKKNPNDKSLLPVVLPILWLSLADNYFASLPKNRVDVGETFSCYMIDYVSSGIIIDSFVKDAMLEILMKETPIYDRKVSIANFSPSELFKCSINSPAIWKGVMFALSKASPEVRESAMTQIASSFQSSFANCLQVSSQSNWDLWLLFCIYEDLCVLVDKPSIVRKTTHHIFSKPTHAQVQSRDSTENDSSEGSHQEDEKENLNHHLHEEMDENVFWHRESTVTKAVQIYSDIFFFLFINNEEFTEEFEGFLCRLQLLGKPLKNVQKATAFLARYIIRSVTIKLTTHVDMFPPGFDSLPWEHLFDWFIVAKTFVLETADWQCYPFHENTKEKDPPILPKIMNPSLPSRRPLFSGKVGVRLLQDGTVEDISILNDVLVLFGQLGLGSIRPEMIYDVVSTSEKESLERLLLAFDFLKDVIRLFSVTETLLLSNILRMGDVREVLLEFLGEGMFVKQSIERRNVLISRLEQVCAETDKTCELKMTASKYE